MFLLLYNTIRELDFTWEMF